MCVCDKIPEDPECNIICKQLPGNQTFDRYIYMHTRRVVVPGGWGNESETATAYKFVT